MTTKLVGKQDIDIFLNEKDGKIREVGHQAVWSLSSCKPGIAYNNHPGDEPVMVFLAEGCLGFGVDQLCDESTDTYWQSDGPQPHLISIQFCRKTAIHDICIYADYKSDESYTPNRISIRVGSHTNDLTEVELLELSEPSGWVQVGLRNAEGKPVRAFMVQLVILSNHQNGRDTHVRRVKIRTPYQACEVSANKLPAFTSKELRQHVFVR